MRALAIALLALVVGCAGLGPAAVNGALAISRRAVGVTPKVRLVDGHRVRTLVRPGDPALVFVHGFTGDATNWDLLLPRLPEDWGLLVMDLPGHGETTPRAAQVSYDIASQTERLDILLEQHGRARVHLVGNSMGGHIVALYASRHPERVASLTLVDAAGVQPTTSTDAMKRFAKGENPYEVRSREELERFFELVFYEPPNLPGFALDYALEQRIAAEPWNKKLREDLASGWVDMEPRLHRITAPTLLVWGEADQVIHPSAADVYAAGIKRSEKAILKRCGHTPPFECPDAFAEVFVPFIERVSLP